MQVAGISLCHCFTKFQTVLLHFDMYFCWQVWQFKTHCKGDSRSSKTANIILPGLMIKQKWTTLHLQAKWYLKWLNCIMLVETTHLTQVESPAISLADVRSFTFVLSWVLAKWLSPLQF